MPLPAHQTPPQRPATDARREHKWEHVLPYATTAVRCVHCNATFVAVGDLSRGTGYRQPRLRWCGAPGPLIGNRLPRWCAK